MRRLKKNTETTKSLKICYLFNISRIHLRPYIDELKWCINSEWRAALGNMVTERAVGEWRQRPPLAFVLKDILRTCCIKMMW